MQAEQTTGTDFSALAASPLGRIRLCSRSGRLTALDFVDEAESPAAQAEAGNTSHAAPSASCPPRGRFLPGGGPAAKNAPHAARDGLLPPQGGRFLPRGGPAAKKPSEGLLDGRRICTFRLAGEGELAFPMRDEEADTDMAAGCRLIEDSLQPDTPQADLALMRKTADELGRYFRGALKVFSIPLQLDGSEFQRRIWQALLEIPLGSSLSYGELAEKAGYAPSSYGRAAGTAVGSNPVSIIVPCHRIVGKDGRMTGYSGGLWRKLRLLSLEGFRIAA